MRRPDELVGLWDSGYAYGVMESSQLALLPDGTGWSTWSNVAGGMSSSGWPGAGLAPQSSGSERST
jgi:hypothetical protein